MILVKGGYAPDGIVVGGKPFLPNFVRQESASCSEMAMPPAFNKSAKRPEGDWRSCPGSQVNTNSSAGWG